MEKLVIDYQILKTIIVESLSMLEENPKNSDLRQQIKGMLFLLNMVGCDQNILGEFNDQLERI